uniref:3-oxo-5alpha-steroid 4-dehydrogenase (NADP(+)) n=1 Tax=Globodera rostochiensis TaxID=31243 RepID=A0A914HI40_GLORO
MFLNESLLTALPHPKKYYFERRMFLLSFLSKFLRISELQHLILHDGRFLLFLANFMIASAVITFVTFNFLGMRASYGRYAKFSTFSEFAIPARIGWFLQEIPSFILPTVAAFWQIKMHSLSLVNALILLMFAGHYFQRSFIYPFLIRGGKAIPVHLLLLGFIFCTWNGTIQGFYHAKYAVYHSDHFWTFGSLIGLPLFALGMFINIQSDQILRSLRASGEIGYKIPRGAMFEFVSSANFFGEIVEWVGYAFFAQTRVAWAFALFTAANTIPRAKEHHRWYLEKFADYPKTRSAIIPFLNESLENSDGIVLDALPYIDDQHYTDEHRQLALQLIQSECKKFPMTKNYLRNLLEPDYDKFLTPRLIELQAKLSNKQEVEKIDLLRYEVPSPANTSRATNKKAWVSAIDNCRAQLANQSLRRMNLEILDEFGPEAFLRSNQHLKRQAEKEEVELFKLRSQLYELNARRKRSQLEAGEKLVALGLTWVELVTKNAGMVVANDTLEAEIRVMAKQLKVDPGINHE